MNWKLKATLQHVFSALPGGEYLYYLTQRHVTRSLPTPPGRYGTIVGFARMHHAAQQEFGAVPAVDAVFYEFGAGWDLLIPLTYYALGVNKQILVDIRNLLRPFLINDVIKVLREHQAEHQLPRVPTVEIPEGGGHGAVLKSAYGIDYRAPCDAGKTGLADGSIDCITTTNTLEHIPKASIQAILKECHRILRDDGVMSHRIDYVDHYALVDRNVSRQAFLRYTEREWGWYNPPLHYQNRLRHSDYMTMFREAGFTPVVERPGAASADDVSRLDAMPLADCFAGYDRGDLVIPDAHIVLKKRRA